MFLVINYNHLVDEILICTHSNSFYEEISKEFSDSFYCMPFLLHDACSCTFTKDSHDSAGKEKQLTIICCEEIIQEDLRED